MMNRARVLTTYALAASGSWLFGVLTYVSCIAVRFGEILRWDGDLRPVVLWSFVAYFLLLPSVYLPCLLALRWWRNGCHPVILFPLVGGALGVLPTAAVVFRWGGQVRDLLSPEAKLFFVLFASAGAVLGLAYAWCHNRSEGGNRRGFAPVLGRI